MTLNLNRINGLNKDSLAAKQIRICRGDRCYTRILTHACTDRTVIRSPFCERITLTQANKQTGWLKYSAAARFSATVLGKNVQRDITLSSTVVEETFNTAQDLRLRKTWTSHAIFIVMSVEQHITNKHHSSLRPHLRTILSRTVVRAWCGEGEVASKVRLCWEAECEGLLVVSGYGATHTYFPAFLSWYWLTPGPGLVISHHSKFLQLCSQSVVYKSGLTGSYSSPTLVV